MTTKLSDCDIAISLGPRARLMPAWGIAPGIKTRKLFPSANGAIHRWETVWVRWPGEVQGLWHGDKFRANGPADTSLGHRPRNPDPPIVPHRQRRGSSVRKGVRATAWRWGGLSALVVFFESFPGALPQAGMKTRRWRSASGPQRRQH